MRETTLKAIVAALVFLSAPIHAFTAEADAIAVVSGAPWEEIATHGSGVVFSKDYGNKHSGKYSLKIENSEYADAHFRKTIPVEKNALYRVSAMARHRGYALNPEDTGVGGANISIWGEWTRSELHTENRWKRITLEFNSGDRDEVVLALRNGFYSGACRGTAWFSDVKIEKLDVVFNNRMNVLQVVFKEARLDHEMGDGRRIKKTVRISDADIHHLRGVGKTFQSLIANTSKNLCVTPVFDMVVIDTPLAKDNIKGRFNSGYCISPGDISAYLDPLLARGDYQMIVVISPIGEITDGWGGLGGSFYGRVGYTEFCDIRALAGSYLHEFIHCLETKARQEGHNNSDLHTTWDKYGYGSAPLLRDKRTGVEAHQQDFMLNTLSYQKTGKPGDKDGLPPSVYSFPHVKKKPAAVWSLLE